MLCIVAFFVVLVLSAVSAKYRKLLGKAWGCTWRRITFRPCDTTFKEDIKNTMLAPLAVKNPKLVKPASIAIEVTAWVMMITLIISIYFLLRSGLNLMVYGTCDKEDAAACTLTSEVCSIDSQTPGFWESIGSGNIIGAFGNEFGSLADTIATIPSRMQTWDAAEFLPEDATYFNGYTEGQPVAVEILDPGCRFCALLFRNMEESEFKDSHNVSYIAYPILTNEGAKFKNSELTATYLQAIRIFEQQRGNSLGVTGDTYVLRQIFTGVDSNGIEWQNRLNVAEPAEVRAQIKTWLLEFGYSEEDVAQVQQLLTSDAVAEQMAINRAIVEDQIRTVSIPTLIADGKLHTGAVSVNDLVRMK